MARISRFKLEDHILEKLFTLFFEVVGKKGYKEEFQKTIADLLSPVERIMIAKRIAIVYLIMKKIDYATICRNLKVSPSTVAKFRLLMEKSEGVIPTLNSLLRNEKIADFLEEWLIDLHAPGTYGANWSIAWQRKKEFQRRKSQGI